MNVSAFINQHLFKLPIPQIEQNICNICGMDITEGVKLNDIVSSNFNDFDRLKYGSKYICKNCYGCLSAKSYGKRGIRTSNFFITNDKLINFKALDFYKLITENKTTPFLILFTFSHKKHAFWYAKVNDKLNKFTIGTDKGRLDILLEDYIHYYKLCNYLYFNKINKTEIGNGISYKFNIINNIPRYFEVNKQLDIVRKTLFLDFILATLTNKELLT